MNVYRTETEQVELIRVWFKKYGYSLSFTILMILFIVGGYHLWEKHTIKIKAQASERYQQLMLGVANGDRTLINAQANDLITHYPKTIYAQAAALTQAKLYLLKKQFARALERFQYVIDNSSQPELRQIARLRMARVLTMEKKYTEALSILAVTEDSVYLPMIYETKGDIYLALNKRKQARLFYKKALKKFSQTDLTSPFLEMKLNNIL